MHPERAKIEIFVPVNMLSELLNTQALATPAGHSFVANIAQQLELERQHAELERQLQLASCKLEEERQRRRELEEMVQWQGEQLKQHQQLHFLLIKLRMAECRSSSWTGQCQ